LPEVGLTWVSYPIHFLFLKVKTTMSTMKRRLRKKRISKLAMSMLVWNSTL
jgi:hypothetical protein